MSKPIVIAHRGFSGIYPENTLLSFQKAIELGAEVIELDIHLSSDGIPMVMHDAKLDRTTNAKGLLAELSFEALRQLDAGSWKGIEFAGEKIPTLDEVFELTKSKTFLHLELKAPGTATVVVDKIRKHGMQHDVIITSFNSDLILEAKTLAPLIPTQKIIYRDAPIDSPIALWDIADLVLETKSNFLGINWSVIHRAYVYELQKRGIAVILYSPDNPEEIQTTLEKHPDAFTTNFPDRAFEIMSA